MRRMADCDRTRSKWSHHNRVLKVAGTEIEWVAGSETLSRNMEVAGEWRPIPEHGKGEREEIRAS